MGRGFGYDISEDRLGVIAGHKRAKEEAAAKEKADRVAARDLKAYQDLLKKRAQARIKAAERRQRERDRKVNARIKKEFDEAAGKLQVMFNTGKMETGLSAEDEASGMLPAIKEEEDEFNYLRSNLNDDDMVIDRRKNGIEAPPNSYVDESPLSAGTFMNGFGSAPVRKTPTIMSSGYTTEDPFAIAGTDCASFYNGSASVNAYAGANGGVNGLTREDEMRARDYYENSAFEEAFYFTGGPASGRYNDKVSTGYL